MSTRTALICDFCGWVVYMPHAISPRASIEYRGWQRDGDSRDMCPQCVGAA